jgi:hypothetical protein
MRGGAGRLHDSLQKSALLVAGRKNAQHGQRSPDRLRAPSRLLPDLIGLLRSVIRHLKSVIALGETRLSRLMDGSGTMPSSCEVQYRVAVRGARIEGISAFAQPARKRPALIGSGGRNDVEIEPLIGIIFRHE